MVPGAVALARVPQMQSAFGWSSLRGGRVIIAVSGMLSDITSRQAGCEGRSLVAELRAAELAGSVIMVVPQGQPGRDPRVLVRFAGPGAAGSAGSFEVSPKCVQGVI